MKSIKILIALFAVPVLFSACTKKDELATKTYYAKVQVFVANLPGTPKLEVRYQNKPIGDAPLGVNGISGVSVEIGTNVLMSVYVKGTGELVADTVLNLKKGELRSFRVAYDKTLGITGWVNSKPVSQDSIALQLLNGLSNFNKTYPAYDFYLYYYDSNTGEFVQQGLVIPDFQNVKLYPVVITLPWAQPSDNSSPIFYLGKIKDRATGQFITFNSGNDFFIFEQVGSGGRSVIYPIDDDNIHSSIPAVEL